MYALAVPTETHVVPPIDETILIHERLPGALDRQLGYFGNNRYVFFYFDTRGDGVLWQDGQSLGFGPGAWRPFAEYIEPLAARYGIVLSERKATGAVLLLDRQTYRAYFAPWHIAQAALAGQTGQPSVQCLRAA